MSNAAQDRPSGDRQQRRAFVVVGMHRSGTSAMTRTLSLLGASLPQGIMSAHEDNPTGFWEPQSVADLNDEILQALDSEWDDVFSFRPRNYLSNFDRFYVGRAVEVLEREFDGSEVIVLKDPRISILTSFWDRALREAGFVPHYVVMVRNPLEVAESLRVRDSFPREKSLLLWSSYMLAVDRDTRAQRRTFVAFEQLMSDWRAVRDRIQKDAGVPFFRDTPSAAIEIDKFIDGRLRHHEAAPDDLSSRPDVPDEVKALYRIFSGACRGEEIDPADLEAIWSELEKIDSFVGPVLADLTARTRSLVKENTELHQAKAGITERAESLAEQLAATEADRDRLAGEVETKTSEASDLGVRLEALETERERLAAELETKRQEASDFVERHGAELEAKRLEASGLLERLGAIQAERDAFQAAALESQNRSEDLAKKAEASEAEAVQIRKLYDEAELRSEALSNELKDLIKKHDELTIERSELKREVAASSREAARLLKAAEADAELQRERYRTAKVELEAVQATVASGEEKLADRYQELATLTQLLGAQERRNREAREQVEWLASLSERMRTQPGWWSLMPVSWRRSRELRRLKNAGLFDGDAYLAANPDVAAQGHDPLQHYVNHGIYEGRQRA